MLHGLVRQGLAVSAALFVAQGVFFCLSSGARAEDTQGLSRKITAPTSAREVYLSGLNRENISVIHQGGELGKIAVYNHLGGTLIPIGALSGLMQWPITVNQDNRVAEGFSPVTNKKITIAPAIRVILVNGEETRLSDNQIFFHQNDIYLETDTISDSLGVHVNLNRSKSTIEIEYKPYENVPEKLSSTLQAEEGNPAEKIVEVQSVSPKSDTMSAQENYGENDTLVLQIAVNNVLMVELLDARVQDGKIFLPFASLTEILEFPIKTDVAKVTAQGWFVRKSNVLSLEGFDAKIKGKSYRIPENKMIKSDEDFYIEKQFLEEWFDLEFKIDIQKLELGIYSKSPFPFEERLKREQLYATLENQKNLIEKEKNFQPYPLPYKGLSIPVIDFNFNGIYQKTAEKKIISPYYIQGSGDLAYMTSRFYLSGDYRNEVINDLRFNMGREDYKKNLLGPLHASSFRFGDINSIGVAQVAQSSEGRGLVLTNRDTTRTDRFDVTNFTGDSTPGWDVELYRNKTLIDTQRVSPDGRYNFNDVPVLFGNNVFRLLLLGPQGQVEEKVKTINASNSIVDPGKFTYNISADQKSKRFVDFRDVDSVHPDGIRLASEFEYGITKRLTATAGGARTFINDGEHKYITAGAKTSFLGVITSLDNAYDTIGKGRSTHLTSFANFFGTNIRFTQKFAKDFVSEADTNIENSVERETGLDLDRPFDLPVLGEFNTGFFFQRKVLGSGIVEKIIRNRLTKTYRGINLTNTMEKNITTGTKNRVFGSFSFRGLLGKNLLGFNADYNIEPKWLLQQTKISWLRNLTPDVMNNFSITRFNGDDVTYQFEDAISFDLKDYKFSLLGRYDTNQDVYLGVTLNFSLGRFPDDEWEFSSRNMSETGIAVGRGYLDSNYNLTREDSEEPVSKIPLRIGSRAYLTNGKGAAVAENLETDGPIYVYADQKNFEDQSLGPGIEGYEIDLRPGYPATIEYPLFKTAEIEGYIEFPENVTIPKNMEVLLINSEEQTVSITRAEFDGYFLFQGVLPGSFHIKIDDEVLKARNLSPEPDEPIVVGDDDFVTVNLKFKSNWSTPINAPD